MRTMFAMILVKPSGALLLSIICLAQADQWPGDAGFDDICREIIDDVAGNAIPFRRLVRTCTGSWWWRRCCYQLQVHETISRAELCNRLTTQHNLHTASFLGGNTVYSYQCQNALASPKLYAASDWNEWSGRHCGTWTTTTGALEVFEDEAVWSSAISSFFGYNRQDVYFVDRNCCNDGWNESGGSEIVVWGWDPKDPSDHGGYQGTHAGYPFTSGSGAECIVWLTGEEAFLECIKTVVSTKKRTSAGFWGFGKWNIKSGPC